MRRTLANDADALLFDLGGVLLEIDFGRAFAAWGAAAGVPAADIAALFSFDAAYAAHERGEISASGYFAALRRSLAIDLSDAQFLAGWNAIFIGEVSAVRGLLAAAARRYPLYLLSNTCAVHRAHWWPRFTDLLQPFAALFLSFEIGLRKPDAEVFAHVARRIGVAAPRIAFFDDTAENVAGARRAGLQAFCVRSPADLAAALRL